jgi:hypothetical protein
MGFRAEYGGIAAFFQVVPEVSIDRSRRRRLADQYQVPLLVPHSLNVEDYRPILTGETVEA